MNHQLLSRGSPAGYDTLSSISTSSTISEQNLQVPLWLYIKDVLVDLEAIRGTGSYGSVYVATWHSTKVAAKRLHEIFFDRLVTSESKFGILRSFAREVNMLIQMNHPNVVQFYGLYSSRHGYELNPETYLVQELMHCSLDSRKHETPSLTLRNIVDISLDITAGLRYLHERADPIIHRDLASKNILLSKCGTAKIADLGVAKILDETTAIPQSRLPGTELYMPPEVKIEGMAYDTKVDIYSFGVVMLEVAIGRDAKANEAFRVSSNNSIVLTPEIERRGEDFHTLGCHPLRSIILSCLSSRGDRPSAKTLSDQLISLSNSQVYLACPVVPVIRLDPEIKQLEEKVKNLQRENELLQAKQQSSRRHSMDSHIDQLMSENALLQTQLARKDEQLRQTLRGQNGQHLITQAETLREENYYLRQKLENCGPCSLPEQLPSHGSQKSSLSSQISQSADQLATMSVVTPAKSEPISDSLEVKRLKKQLEKYKSVNIEMDQKLKEARLELKRLGNGHSEYSYRREADELRGEVGQMSGRLDSALRENSYLQSQLSAALSQRY